MIEWKETIDNETTTFGSAFVAGIQKFMITCHYEWCRLGKILLLIVVSCIVDRFVKTHEL